MSPPMSPLWTGSPPWTAGYQSRRRAGPNSDLRVSDSDRTDVADLLSKHYGDGRLDQAEFNERMERAMGAKTQGDFAGLFADLPDLTEPQNPVPVTRPRSRSPMYRLAMLILIITAAVFIGHALASSFFPWLLLALVAFLWLRHEPRNRGRT